MSQNKPVEIKDSISVPADARVLVAASRYNENFVNHLLERFTGTLEKYGISKENITVLRVPGANEIPAALAHFLPRGNFSAAVALGTVIAGATPHHEIIAHSTAAALQQIALSGDIPVINGIVVTNNEAQANERVFGGHDRGSEFANAAAEMMALFDKKQF